jgi:hypothetical protein
MKTELRDGQRVWTKESIELILTGYKYKGKAHIHYQQIKMLFWKGLGEAGFEQKKGVAKKDHFTMVYESEKWFCSVHLLYLKDEAKVVFIIGLKMHPVEDLVYLWDYIRSSWSSR